VLSGIGNSVIHPADYAILSGSIRKEVIGRSFALHTFSGNAGFVLAPFVMTLLLTTVGWRGAVMAAGVLGLLVVGLIVLQSRILSDQVRTVQRHPDGRVMRGLTTRDLLTSRTLWLFFGFYLLSAMATGGLQAWLITVLRDVRGLDVAIASMGLTSLLLGNAAGVLLGGWVTDRYPRLLLLFTISFTIVSAGLLLVVAALQLTASLVLALLFASGFTMGASRTPRDVMLKEAAPKGQIGKVFGFVSSGLPLGSALTPVPFGFLLDHHMPTLVLPTAAALLLASLFCMGSAKMSAASDEAAPAPVPAE
jgi:MFS family permease